MNKEKRIPRIIHYCWFGKGEKPKIVLKCIESWKKHLHDYEIKEWNEENFDINCNTYVSEAYKMRKYAFVSTVSATKTPVIINRFLWKKK